VYVLLSDPAARLAYDQEQARRSEFAGYTGRPLYSSWLGPESERRAVFVDEVRCVGCLKCALHASRTFAIESVYGRARAVAQWADDEDRIVDAINTCPVDCISYVIHSRIDSSSIHATMPINRSSDSQRVLLRHPFIQDGGEVGPGGSRVLDVQAAARQSPRLRRQRRGSSRAQHLQRSRQVPEKIRGDEAENRDQRIPGD
jgi:ferredoxin